MTEAALTLVDGRAQVRKALEEMECSVAYTVRGRPRSMGCGRVHQYVHRLSGSGQALLSDRPVGL